MQILLTTAAPTDGEELGSLYRVLLQAPTVRGGAQLRLREAPPRPGEMGGAFEAIQLVVESAFQVANLVIAIAAWRSTRKPPPTITIRIDSRSAEITSDQPEQIDRVIESLRDPEF
ncbi:hypothetical protein JOD64_005307 [Micromonospora luteifusca]|uniref:Uncharacterized protein n=1 Tax=Micromonospora luteifusca TaxID=709860 RepID=A0ABS2M0W2_9ACTN|nr:hypothetical protein [Micromonospora luteifusca]MBM7494085.1 hypothetical protein [Micromonospora luteifusca]